MTYDPRFAEGVKAPDGSPAAKTITANQQTPPSENVLPFTFTLDGTTTDEHILQNTENYSAITFKVTGILGSVTISMMGDVSGDQSGVYSAKMSGFGSNTHPNSGTNNVNMPNNNVQQREKLCCSAIRIYVSTADAGSGGTVTITGLLKGGV